MSKRHNRHEEEGGERQGIFLEEFEISESDSITSSQAKGQPTKFRNTHYGGNGLGHEMYYRMDQPDMIEEKAKQIMKSNLNNNSKFERTSSYNENHMSSTLTHFYKRNPGAQPEQPFPVVCSKTGTNFRQNFASEEQQKPEITGIAGDYGMSRS